MKLVFFLVKHVAQIVWGEYYTERFIVEAKTIAATLEEMILFSI